MFVPDIVDFQSDSSDINFTISDVYVYITSYLYVPLRHYIESTEIPAMWKYSTVLLDFIGIYFTSPQFFAFIWVWNNMAI